MYPLGPPGVVLRTLSLGLSKRAPSGKERSPQGIPPRGPREGTQAGDTPEYPPGLGYPLPRVGSSAVCTGQTYFVTQWGACVREKCAQGGGGRTSYAALAPPRPPCRAERTLNGTLTCEGPFNVAGPYRHGGNPWVKGLGGGRRFLGSPTPSRGKSPVSGPRLPPCK